MAGEAIQRALYEMPNRREFLAATSAALLWPRDLAAFSDRLAHAANQQELWADVRRQFLIPTERVYLNIGTLGPQPRPVFDATVEHMRRVAMSLPPGIDWNKLKSTVASYLNCDPEGLVFPRNTTEGMNFVANGLDFEPGDEVVTTDHEHIGGLCCWQLIAKRKGVKLTQVALPTPPLDPDAAFDAIARAVTPATRVISVSHVNFTNGLVMPVRRLIDAYRPRGIIIVVDGAHPPGLMPVDLRSLDPDFYASSPHKWLFAAQGTGLLHLRDEWRTKLWPTLASGDWDNLELGAQRLNHLGSFDESRLASLLAAIEFHNAIGPDRVYARIEELRQRLLRNLRDNPRIEVVSPTDSRGAGMVSFRHKDIASLELQRRLGQHNIRTRVIGEYNYGWMRLSASVYNLEGELDRVSELIRTI